MRSLIINTVDKCVGCNRCVRGCPISETNIASGDEKKIIVEVDNNKCIACGYCLENCHHGSRSYEDDTELFFNDLKNGVPISLFAAPAAKSNFDDWERMLSWLRSLGVKKIFDVSLGADICTWAHIRYFQKNGLKPVISQPCPVIVNYILMHRNELIKYLSPIHSPMLCTAVLMRKYENVNTKIAALSPCIAKAHEFELTRMVDYNVTINNLVKYIEENQITFPLEPSGFDHYDSGLGSLYAMPGGLKENVEHYLGKSIRVDKSEGVQAVYHALDEYAKQPASRLPVLFDVLNCGEGCNMGTGCKKDKDIFEINASMDKLRQAAIQDENRAYLDELFERFDKTLRLEDFIRTYQPTPIKKIKTTQEDIERAFESLGKFTEEDRIFDCGACGRDTCLEMAELIAKGINTPFNCMRKAHDDAIRERQVALDNLKSFKEILDDTTGIKEITESMVGNLDSIMETISAYDRMITDIEKIALQISIISINASIEAARAGQQGRSFSIIAEEIRKLAHSSDNSAKQTKEASIKADEAIKSITEMVSEMSSGINASYENIYNISENTKKVLRVEDE